MDDKTYEWIIDVLTNDENASDKELVEYFMKEGKMSKEEAEYYVRQRDEFINSLFPEPLYIYDDFKATKRFNKKYIDEHGLEDL